MSELKRKILSAKRWRPLLPSGKSEQRAGRFTDPLAEKGGWASGSEDPAQRGQRRILWEWLRCTIWRPDGDPDTDVFFISSSFTATACLAKGGYGRRGSRWHGGLRGFLGGAKFTALAPFFEHFVLSVDPSSSANYRRIYE